MFAKSFIALDGNGRLTDNCQHHCPYVNPDPGE